MITESIIVAIITGITTITGSYLVNRKDINKEKIERAKREENIDSRLKTIEKKLDEHNHYAQKFGEIEKSIVRIDTILSSNKKGK
jgi:hypothetical protein